MKIFNLLYINTGAMKNCQVIVKVDQIHCHCQSKQKDTFKMTLDNHLNSVKLL
jgi:hypothetical protein